jgi:hypothetical protein
MKEREERRPEAAGGVKGLFDPADAIILLLDHQSGLLQTVKDIGVAELRGRPVSSRRSGPNAARRSSP